jgi:replicative DNA helicase
LYVCRNPHLTNSIDEDFFRNAYVGRLYKVVKQFYKNFKNIPFDLDNPSVEQIEIIANKNPKICVIDDGISQEENVKNFVANSEHIINTPYEKYSRDWLDESIKSWIQWENFQKGFRMAVEYQKTQKVTPENMKDVINKSKEIFNSRSNISFDDDLGDDFEDPETHKQTQVTDLISTGWSDLNTWLSGSHNGGWEKGTLNFLVGETNIGKSIWLANIAFNAYVNGYNVLLISLEMSSKKLAKRIGSNAFDINIGDYTEFANDKMRMTDYINELKANCGTGLKPIGKLRIKRFGSAGCGDIRSFIRKSSQELNVKWDLIVLDYFTELNNDHGISIEKSYFYHKSNAGDLFEIGVDEDVAVVTAHQLSGDAFGAGVDDISMKSLGESKGINHVADNIIAIAQTAEQRLNREYYLKYLKPRDGAYKNYKLKFEIDYEHMRLIGVPGMIDPSEAVF